MFKFLLAFVFCCLGPSAWAMKYNMQVQDRTMPAALANYRFICDVDTKMGVDYYSILVPPIDGYKYNSMTKTFVRLTSMELTTAWDAFDADQKKIFLLQKWRTIAWWILVESPLDDGFPPWPGIRI